MKRVESGDKYRSVSTVDLHHDQPSSNAVKVRIPVKEYPAVSSCFSYVTLIIWPVIHLQFWAYGSWDSLFPISMSPNSKLMSPEHCF